MIHGTRAAYARSCRCDDCRAANAAYTKLQRYRQATGIETLIDSGPVRDHLKVLRAAGMSRRRIVELSGVASSVVGRLMGVDRSAPARRLRHDTAAKLLALKPAIHEDASCIPGIGTTRRLQALVAIGHTQTAIAARMGWVVNNINALVLGHQRQVTVNTARMVAGIYDELSMKPGDSERSRRVARERKWVSPLAWDDETIDDPQAKPQGVVSSRKKWGVSTEDVIAYLNEGIPLVRRLAVSV